ncbi:hypothetical protein HanIR_Chr12g0577111 [Helianthus annuus]|nr:hypothetical protein HanIR_Chr12g0577111 [Helianthus annuus]
MYGRKRTLFDSVHGIPTWVEFKITNVGLRKYHSDTGFVSHCCSRACLRFEEDRSFFSIQTSHTHLECVHFIASRNRSSGSGINKPLLGLIEPAHYISLAG